MTDSNNNEDLNLGFSEILSTTSPVEEAAHVIEPEDVETPISRLSWIKEQLFDEALPSSMLTGIFDEICEDAKSLSLTSDNLRQITEIATLLSDKLMVQSEYELAASVQEKAYRITDIIPDNLMSSLDAALKEFPDSSQLTTTQMKRQLRLLSVKREIEDKLPKANVIPSVEENFIEPIPKLAQGVGRSKILFIMVFFIAALTFSAYKLLFQTDQEFKIALSHDFAGFEEPTIMPPVIESDKDLSQLAFVYYDINNINTSSSVQIREVKSDVTTTEVKPELRKEAATLNMDGPYETRRIEEILHGGSRGQDSRYDDTNDESPVRNSDRDRNRDRIRDIYDSRRRDEIRYDERRRDLNIWDRGDRYEVLINTSVMERPSFKSKEVAELYVGDYIVVEARLGRWLRIRSVRGAPGFILAQDAEKVFE